MNFFYFLIFNILIIIIMLIMILISVAFFTLFERKMMSIFHIRKGPNKISIFGMLQPFSDALKLLLKEIFYSFNLNIFIYMISPLLLLITSLLLWMIYPYYSNLFKMNYSFLIFILIMSTSIYSLIFSGWSSNSSFSLIGSIRSIAQSISYEINLAIAIFIIIILINSMNIFKMNFINFSIMMNFPIFYIILISLLAEINRTPFDFSESESELISGFNIEYSSSNFTLIFLAEYSSIMFMMMLFNMMYYLNPMKIMFYLNFMFMLFWVTWIRMTFPRLRYDKLMNLCWMFLLPMNLILFLIYINFMKFF